MVKFFTKHLALVLIAWLLLSGQVSSQTTSLISQPPDLREFFNTPYGDNYSAVLLNQIFGPLFPAQGQAPEATLFSTLVGIMNGTVLGLAIILFLYNVVIATLQTAHEGNLLGSRYSSLWVPIRLLLAVLLILPVPGLGGYNLLQSGIAWLVKGSTVAASEVWRLGSQDLISGEIPIIKSSFTLDPELFKVAYRNQLCVKIANYQLREAESQLRVEFKQIDASQSTTFMSHLDNKQEGICGSYSIPEIPHYIQKLPSEFSAPIASAFRTLHTTILNRLITRVNDIIDDQWEQFVVQSISLEDFSGLIQETLNDLNQLLADGNRQINQLIVGSNQQNGSARQLIKDYLSGSDCNFLEDHRTNRTMCTGEGWIGAGNWYMTIARLNTEVVGLLKASIGATDTHYINKQKNSLNQTIVVEADEISNFQRFFMAVNGNKYLGLDETQKIWGVLTSELESSSLNLAASGFNIPEVILEASTTLGGGGFLGKIWQVGFADGVEAMIANLSPSRWANDPIVGIVNIGHWYLDVAGTLILGSAVVSLFSGSISTTVIFLIAGPLAAIGITLSFILPLLPFFLWIIAVASYFLLVIEAIIGSTLWLLAHLRMDGEGLSGNYGQRGWMILLGLLLTPPLMVMGYFVGMILFKITATLLDLGFYFAMSALVNSSPIVGIFGLIATGFLLVIAYIAIIERSFSLITHFPNRILMWIGGDVDLSHSEEYSRIQSGGRILSSSVRGGIAQLNGKLQGGGQMIKSYLSKLNRS